MPSRHRHIHTEPNWLSQKRCTAFELPRRTRRWLLDDGSLTARLQAMGELRVQRLFQGWEPALPSEQRLLDQPRHQLSLVREVLLSVEGKALVFARSLFPVSSLSGELTHLRRLQNKPLGAILFSHPGMHRSPFEVAKLAGDCDYLPRVLHQGESAWGRRSRFEIEGKALIVSEVFLQDFRPWPDVIPVHRTQRGVVNAAILHSKS